MRLILTLLMLFTMLSGCCNCNKGYTKSGYKPSIEQQQLDIMKARERRDKWNYQPRWYQDFKERQKTK